MFKRMVEKMKQPQGAYWMQFMSFMSSKEVDVEIADGSWSCGRKMKFSA